MPSAVKVILKDKWSLLCATFGLLALLAVSGPPIETASDVKSQREMTLSSMSKPNLPLVVLTSPALISTTKTPITLTATIQSANPADHVNVTWALPAGVTLASGTLTSSIAHLDAAQPASVSISVTVAAGVTKPILVNALFAHGSVTVGNGGHIAVNRIPAAQQRVHLETTGDGRIFE